MDKKIRAAGQTAASVLMERHSDDNRSWAAIARELGYKSTQKAMICEVARCNRKPSKTLLIAINTKYGSGVSITRYPPHPVTRLTRLTNRERAKREFEARYGSRLNLTVSSQDNYMNSETRTMWLCWLNSRLVAAAGGEHKIKDSKP
jgi:thymidylate kinase